MIKLKTISVRISDEEKEVFEKFCKRQDLTMSYMLRKYIKEIVEREKSKN